MSYRRFIPGIIGALLLFACSGKEREFTWDEQTAALTGKNVKQWLRTAPFSNELAQTDANRMVFTNADEVFPFKGKYNNAVDELPASYTENSPVYQEETVLYQDPKWGDLFVTAALLYEDEEVFLRDSYSETGNPMFGGSNAVLSSYHASLEETAVKAGHKRYKTALYWTHTSGKSYLLGFYQGGKLLFEVAVPLKDRDTLGALNKLKEVNTKMKLDIPEWERAAVTDLVWTGTEETFWKNPFRGIYLSPKTAMEEVELKLKDTPLKASEGAFDGDYSFEYKSSEGKVVLYTVRKDTDKEETVFNEERKDQSGYTYGLTKVFYKEKQEGDQVKGVAVTYLKNHQYLELHYTYPATDEKARSVVHGVLKYIRIFKF